MMSYILILFNFSTLRILKGGFVIFQKIGNHNLRALFEDSFNTFLERENYPFKLQFTSFQIPHNLDEILNYPIHKIKLRHHNLDSDVVKSIRDGDSHKYIVEETSFRIKPHIEDKLLGSKQLKTITKSLVSIISRDNYGTREFVEFEDYDEFKAQIDVNGKLKWVKIDISEYKYLERSYNVALKREYTSPSEPSLDYVKEQCDRLVLYLLRKTSLGYVWEA